MKTVALLFLLVALCNCDCDTSSEVENAFSEYQIVPDILSVAPTNFLTVFFPRSGVAANLGNELTPTEMIDEPTLSWDADEDALYALLAVDPDVPSRTNPKERELRHWFVINIPGTSVDQGNVEYEYLSPAPPKDGGLHRYVFMIFKQRNGIIDYDGARVSSTDVTDRLKTSTKDLAEKYNLGHPEFGNFAQAKYDQSVDG